MKLRLFVGIFFGAVMSCSGWAQAFFDAQILPADAMPEKYVPLLKNKRVALIINQTSRVGDSSLLDMLLQRNVQIVKIFVPEHGFRGSEDAGAKVDNTVDSATQLPVISLYGSHKKPTTEDLADVDIVVYDLQDVGVRFYTYIATMEYCMEACAQQHKQFLILDRPDPNGFYVDGPLMEQANRSFVGMQPIPIVYGMTCGEYATMLAGERWFANATDIDFKVIRCINYTHKKKYELPVAPSPNLRTMAAIYAYPSLCLFEGTVISVGRGTDKPFQQYGCPEFEGKFTWSFTPESREGAKKPLYENKQCYGEVVASSPGEAMQKINNSLVLSWLIKAYNLYPDKDKFFTGFFLKLAGSSSLAEQIQRGATEAEIRAAWQNDLVAFRKIRSKYLLYEDF